MQMCPPIGRDVRHRDQLKQTHTETRRLVGRDLSSLVMGSGAVPEGEPVYFMTSDDVSRGLEQITGRRHWTSVTQPNQVETIFVDLEEATWKYSRYYQDLSPLYEYIKSSTMTDSMEARDAVPDEFEMYDLTHDPIEAVNLAGQGNAMEETLKNILQEQRDQKCLEPRVPGERRDQGEGLPVEADA